VGNVNINVYAKCCCTLLYIKKASEIFGPLENGFQEEEEEELQWLFGTRLPGPKTAEMQTKATLLVT